MSTNLYHHICGDNNETEEPVSVHGSIDWFDFWNHHIPPMLPTKLKKEKPIRIGIHKVNQNSVQMKFDHPIRLRSSILAPHEA